MKPTVIDQKFGLLAMRDEQLICTFEPNSRFVLYQTLKNAWHPFVVILLPLVFLFALRSRRFQKYWITNKRVIAAKGVLGFTVQSIPLEKVSDVSLMNSWLHRLLGTASIAVKDISGNAMGLVSVDKAPEMQLLILDCINDLGRGQTTP